MADKCDATRETNDIIQLRNATINMEADRFVEHILKILREPENLVIDYVDIEIPKNYGLKLLLKIFEKLLKYINTFYWQNYGDCRWVDKNNFKQCSTGGRIFIHYSRLSNCNHPEHQVDNMVKACPDNF